MSCKEQYFALHAPSASSPRESLEHLAAGLREKLRAAGMDGADVILLRFFSSDPTRHAPIIARHWPTDLAGQKVIIGQAPLDSRYLSLQAWAIKGNVEKSTTGDGALILRHGGYTSLWALDIPEHQGTSEQQTDEILSSLGSRLYRHGMNLESNVIRTWYYIRDIDNNYAGMVRSRVRHYETHGLTPSSHFIASTGIEGQFSQPHALAWVHSHAIRGLKEGQIRYLRALGNMSPTAVYGVNFERGTLVTYGDRKHAHISGTASIDSQGEIMFRGDVEAQTQRALANVEALLREGQMSLRDMKTAIVYCRDGHDYAPVAQIIRNTLPQSCAISFTKAPVCRPEWLVEIEGEAAQPCHAPQFSNYL